MIMRNSRSRKGQQKLDDGHDQQHHYNDYKTSVTTTIFAGSPDPDTLSPPPPPGNEAFVQKPGATSIASSNSSSNKNPATIIDAEMNADDSHSSEAEIPWGPEHPCFPHMNAHVPVTSPEYSTTRIIRIHRDWMVAGDSAPTFSNLYPELLDPVLSQQEFRAVLGHINAELMAIFNPFGILNWIDTLLALLTGWIWDDLGFTTVKRRLIALERYIEDWNHRVGENDGVKIWPLRSTGYMSLDIQIPDPKIDVVGETSSSHRGGNGDDMAKAHSATTVAREKLFASSNNPQISSRTGSKV